MVVIEVVVGRVKVRAISLALIRRQFLGCMAGVRDRAQLLVPLLPLPLAAAWVRVRVKIRVLV